MRYIALCLSLFLDDHFRLARVIRGLLVVLGLVMILLFQRCGAVLQLRLLMLRGSEIDGRFILLLALMSLAMADETWVRKESDMITAV